MDIVFIEQLSVITTIGVYDWEQTIEQKLVFDLEIAWDNRKAAASEILDLQSLTRKPKKLYLFEFRA